MTDQADIDRQRRRVQTELEAGMREVIAAGVAPTAAVAALIAASAQIAHDHDLDPLEMSIIADDLARDEGIDVGEIEQGVTDGS